MSVVEATCLVAVFSGSAPGSSLYGGDVRGAVGPGGHLRRQHRAGLLLVFEERRLAGDLGAGVEDQAVPLVGEHAGQWPPGRREDRQGPVAITTASAASATTGAIW
jgi:hypothetical protein